MTEEARESGKKDDQDDCQEQTGGRRRLLGIQREDNAVSNVRGITMSPLEANGPAGASIALRFARFTARRNVFVSVRRHSCLVCTRWGGRQREIMTLVDILGILCRVEERERERGRDGEREREHRVVLFVENAAE